MNEKMNCIKMIVDILKKGRYANVQRDIPICLQLCL